MGFVRLSRKKVLSSLFPAKGVISRLLQTLTTAALSFSHAGLPTCFELIRSLQPPQPIPWNKLTSQILVLSHPRIPRWTQMCLYSLVTWITAILLRVTQVVILALTHSELHPSHHSSCHYLHGLWFPESLPWERGRSAGSMDPPWGGSLVLESPAVETLIASSSGPVPVFLLWRELWWLKQGRPEQAFPKDPEEPLRRNSVGPGGVVVVVGTPGDV